MYNVAAEDISSSRVGYDALAVLEQLNGNQSCLVDYMRQVTIKLRLHVFCDCLLLCSVVVCLKLSVNSL